MANHSSHYSMNSATPRSNTMQASHQVSTTTLLNALHTSYLNGQPYQLESSTSLVVNTWANAVNVGPDGRIGGTVDLELGRKAWEHARRRAEDGCIILGSLHQSTPPLLAPFASALPLSVPATFYTAINTLRPFLSCVTPFNPTTPRHSALSATFVLSLAGELSRASLSLCTSGIDVKGGLLNIPAESGYRAFDVFYYILKTPSRQEREYLQLKDPSQYTLLRKSETYSPPSYLPTADDAAAAEDFKNNLKTLGIKGSNYRNLVSVLAALLRLGDGVGFLVNDDELEQICDEVSGLIEVDPEVLMNKLGTEEREVLIAGIYEAVVDWVIAKANEAIRNEMHNGTVIGSSSGSDSDEAGAGAATPPSTQEDEGDKVSITVVEVSNQSLGKAASLKTVFDDTDGINKEMKEDGVPIVPAGSSVIREMKDAVAQSEPDLDIMTGPLGRERDHELDRRQGVLEKVGTESEPDSFLRQLLYPVSGEGIVLGKTGRFNLTHVLNSSRVWFQLCLHPNDENPAKFANQPSLNHLWSAGAVSGQIRGWRLPEWANYRNKQLDFTADFDEYEFTERYGRIGCQSGRDGIQNWLAERGWSNGEIVLGEERVWLREGAWWEAECLLDLKTRDEPSPSEMMGGMVGAGGMENGYSVQTPNGLDSLYAPNYTDNPFGDAHRQPSVAAPSAMRAKSLAPTAAHTVRSISGGDYGLGHKGDDKYGVNYEVGDSELIDGKVVVEQRVSFGRRVWIACAWAATFWAPSFLLKHVGRMKRPDVRMAWREKILLVLIIFLLNAIVVFYIVAFGKLICPKWDKAWNAKEVGYHQGDNDWWVSFRGGVYDLTDFWQLQHSDVTQKTTSDNMAPFAGTDVSNYIPPPLYRACAAYVDSDRFSLIRNETLEYPAAIHTSGNQSTYQSSVMANEDWYDQKFLPKMEEYYKGELVVKKSKVKSDGNDNQHMWVIIDEIIYDFTDYFHTKDLLNDLSGSAFLPDDVEELIQSNPGGDITKDFNNLDRVTRANSLNCFDNAFKVASTDFRESARCQVNNYILLAFTIIICLVIGTKFIAALQLGSRRRPAQQDKFVICQVPAYTEGEDSMRKGLDSLTALQYDNKRKLLCVICDGMVVGGGNDRPTPKIVLDILGVDPKIDPPALPVRAVGTGSEQLNYGKVYSGLYEFEGNVVPYLVVVKVGKESEQQKSKPGNRGKRDSQIMLMNFLNRVHHRAPMSPLELEMFHQINNIIGVDPELYEYLFMVDADTKVKEDSLNRLVAACANDSKIIGICGETSLENEERSWWTMIQVYEYYISHHLSKAFESLFGSVTCLPGCFCMYRLRTADKGRPLIISDQVIKEYADINTDTLHKKNLLSLGEDRWLTTLMTKYFPHYSFKFIPDAYALTEAPSDWNVLLSQRRRWINSTIHNLAELVMLKDLCGFCCFSMRFVVFVDLFGTIILPATCAYLTYLIVIVATGQGQFPLISLIMICSVYGLQALIFIIKRQWQHIGWMLIYLLAYPIYSFILPVYSFWKQDDFSWGNTRLVLNENGKKALVAVDEEGFDPRSIPLQRWDDYAGANNLPGRRGLPVEKEPNVYADDRGYELDEVQSVYSAKPTSTILTGFPQQQTYQPPQSPGPFNAYNRQSSYSHLSRYTDNPLQQQQQYQQQFPQKYQQTPGSADPQHNRLMSMGSLPDYNQQQQQQQFYHPRNPSQDNLLSTYGLQSPPLPQQYAPRARSPLNASTSRPQSTANMPGFQTQGPTNEAITQAIQECLAEVDLDSVTKKQLKALAEQKLQCQVTGERRAFLDGQIDYELANMA